MRPFARNLFCAACLLSLTAVPAVLADDEDDATPSRQASKEKRDARRGKDKEESASVPPGTYGKEVAALNRAAEALAKVKDEASATEVAKALCKEFTRLNPLLGGSDGELMMLSRAQNKVSKEMWKLMAEPYFESSGLQEAWTLMTDQFSRRKAQKQRRK